MNCSDVETLILSEICQALPEKLQPQVDAHLQNCPACQAKWQEATKQLAKFQHLAPPATPKLSAQKILQTAHRRAMWLRSCSWGVILLIFLGLLWIGWLTAVYRRERVLLGDLEKAVIIYRLEKGQYPATLAALLQEAQKIQALEPYLLHLLPRIQPDGSVLDYWQNPFRYSLPGKHNPGFVDIYSLGRNRKDDQGKGDDIKNWAPGR